MTVVASAMVLSFLGGQHQEQSRPTPYKKTVKAPAFSIFRRGFDFIRHLLIKSSQEALNLLSFLILENLQKSYI